MNFYFTFNNYDVGKTLVRRFMHRGMSASIRPVQGTNNRWTVFGRTGMPEVDIEPIAFGLKYLDFRAEEEEDA